MAKLGSKKRPVVLRVQNEDRLAEVAQQCEDNGVTFVAGIEADKPEDISDLEKVLNHTPGERTLKTEKTGRNEPCPCGSGKKYKKCCGAPGA